MIFVPIVNLLLWFIPGTKDDNRYGPPPPPNSAGVGVLAFLMPTVAIVGILAAVIFPAYHDYTVRERMQKDVNISNAYRAALQISCAKGEFRPGLPDVKRTLGDPQQYTSEYVESITVVDLSQQIAEITVTYRAIGNAITAGQTVIFIGTCRDAVVDWEVAGTVAEKFRPRI